MNTKSIILSLLFLWMSIGINVLQAQCGTMMTPLSIEQRTQEATTIVEGRIVSSQSFWNPTRTKMYTRHTLNVFKNAKGNTVNTVEFITQGGTVDDITVDVSSEPQLQQGQIGLFFLRPPLGIERSQLGYLELVGAAQGVIGYDTKEGSARDVFNRYNNIETDLYSRVQRSTGRRFAVLQEAPSFQTSNRNSSSAPVISSFSPTTVSAGTKTTITITGSNFGTTQGDVEFINADAGFQPYVTGVDSEYISWTDTQIVIEVPYDAATGKIRVVSSTGDVGTSASKLTITYAHLGRHVASTQLAYRTVLMNDNGNNGYDFNYSTNFTNTDAIARYEESQDLWYCSSGLNFIIDENTSTVTETVYDNINIIRWDTAADPLSTGVLGAVRRYTSSGICNGVNYSRVLELDVTFNDTDDTINWYFGTGDPTSSQIDFKSVALHELGHAHQLGHVNDNNKIMHNNIASGNNRFYLVDTDVEGANAVMDFFQPENACFNETMEELLSTTYTTDLPTHTNYCTVDLELTVATSGTSDAYQWYYLDASDDIVPLTDDTNFSGTGTGTLTIADPFIYDGLVFYCEATGEVGCRPVQSTHTVMVDQRPELTSQPSNVSICLGENTSFSVVATNVSTYSWQRRPSDSSTWQTLGNDGIHTGYAAATLSVGNAPEGYDGSEYRCLITGCESNEVTSNAVTLQVKVIPELVVTPVNGQCGQLSHIEVAFATSNTANLELSIDGGLNYTTTIGAGSLGTIFQDLVDGDYSVYARFQDDSCPEEIGTYTVAQIEDTENPIARCKDITVYLDADGNAFIETADIDDGSTDNCDIDTYLLDIDSFTCADLGVNQVELEVTDIFDNLGYCISNVTVVDEIAPTISSNRTITHPAPTDILNNVTEAYNYDVLYELDIDANANYSDIAIPYTQDNTTSTLDTYDRVAYYFQLDDKWVWVSMDDFASGNLTALGIPKQQTNDVTWEQPVQNVHLYKNVDEITSSAVGQDLGDNKFNIEFWHHNSLKDANDPDSDNTGSSSSFDQDDQPGAIPNGSGSFQVHRYKANQPLHITTLFSFNSFMEDDVVDVGHAFSYGSNDRDWTDYENANDYTIRKLYVLVGSNSLVNLALDANGEKALSIDELLPDGSIADTCSSVTTTITPAIVTCSDIGETDILITATDASGNTATYGVVVDVQDTTPPTVYTQNITIDLDENDVATITPDQIDNGSTDACGIESYTLDISSFDCGNVGDNAVTLTITDTNGNTASQTAIVTVTDESPLVIPNVASNLLPPQEALATVSEASTYQVLYQVDIQDDGVFTNTDYMVNNSSVITDPYARVAYYLQLDDQWIWVSMDDFAGGDLNQLGLPDDGLSYDITYETGINNLNVYSNVAGVTTGEGITTGNIEIWKGGQGIFNNDYDVGNPVFKWDYDDSPDNSVIHGAFQVHNYGTQETYLGFNGFNWTGANDVGIGNANIDLDGIPVDDWFAAENADQYTVKKLYILVEGANQMQYTATLDGSGNVSITQADLETLFTFDDCGEVTWSISQTDFTCDDIGENTIQVTGTGTGGNTTSVDVIVNVEGANNIACADPLTTFNTKWETTQANQDITIRTGGGTFDYQVDWGDGNVEDFSGTHSLASATHTYESAGIYTVKIAGTFPSISMGAVAQNEKNRLMEVTQWGTNPWDSFIGAFSGCTNLQITATDAPDLSAVTALASTFANCTNLNSDISNWDVSTIDRFDNMFQACSSFNQDLSSWSMSGATSLYEMFVDATSFDQNLGSWDISSVGDMEDMLTNTGMSTQNYDTTLIGWRTLNTSAGETTIPLDIELGSSASYCNSELQRQDLIDTYNWTIIDGGLDCTVNTVLLSTKVYLQGSYTNPVTAGLMNDNLGVDAMIPTTSPYTDAAVTTTDILQTGGVDSTRPESDDIVDWVWVELRDPNDNTVVIAAQSALLQRDGDVVSADDGSSPLSFVEDAGNYLVTLNHRNHLGIMSASAISMSATATALDFTASPSVVQGGTLSVVEMSNGVYALFAGDQDASGQVQSTDLTPVINALGTAGYSDEDIDMNGQVQTIDINNILIPNIGKGQSFNN